MNTKSLREILRPDIIGLGAGSTHAKLPALLAKLDLPQPLAGSSKAEKMGSSFDATTDTELGKVAIAFITEYPSDKRRRNRIQDLLWEGSAPEVSRRFRRDVARKLQVPLFLQPDAFILLLDSLWILDNNPYGAFLAEESTPSLREQIERHAIKNPEDWDAEKLFEEVGAFAAGDGRFAKFLEGLASADVIPDVSAQRGFVEAVNSVLIACGAELRETGEAHGYPVFHLAWKKDPIVRKAKNVIFASSIKPDLRLSDAVFNDIEIVTNADKVLVYDRTISAEGVTWSHLQAWWSELNGTPNDDRAKTTLYARLSSCLPTSSPPQQWFYSEYHYFFGKRILTLPALLPEVWLHWDPKTVDARGAAALPRFRMDFLMLLPNHVRVVIEIDGIQHYANEQKVADPARYASMVSADRDLRLAGYEVFRFGGGELRDKDRTRHIVGEFFTALFERYRVV